MPARRLASVAIGVQVAVTVVVGWSRPAQATEAKIRWRAGTEATRVLDLSELTQTLVSLNARTNTRRLVVQFNKPVDGRTKESLLAAGLRLSTYLGDDAYLARLADAGADVEAVAKVGSLISVAPFESHRKIHPYLAAGNVPPWAVVPSAADGDVTGQPTVALYVMFHSDVALVARAEAVVRRHGALVRDRLETINSLVIEMPIANLATLAAEDEVLWIEQPLPQMETVNDSNRTLTGAGTVQAAPYNLDGEGVRVLVFDAFLIDPNHQDFAGRIVNDGDTSGVVFHATHVAGTVGGSGAASGGQFRGMAPAVDFVTFGFQWDDGLGTFLYSNPGDMEQDYGDAIQTHGAHISNNSIGTNTCWNGFPCSITGDYGVTDALIDQIVRGVFGEPFRVVWANGNERSCFGCPGVHHPEGYHSTAPPACAKNHLTVGALNSNDDSMTDFSSWGPCDDGRIKPDVAAPGCESSGDGGVTSANEGGGYSVLCGTSMASPTACGVGALLLQDFREQFPDRPDFRNSTLRAMLAHTADDWGAADGLVGPDYRSGYGSIRAQAAVDFLRTGNFLEAEVDQDAVYSVLVIVNPGDPAMKVTLAWDDPFNVPLVEGALINNLDLVVFDPSGERRYPWTLDPENPGEPATQNQPDLINNIEQVHVDSAEPGVWRVEVHGTTVPQGPQVFSLAGSPLVVNCSTRGVVSLDRAKYACGSMAVVQVVDCDLNTDDKLVETISINVSSSLEPNGETITLTESGGATSLFRGMISLGVDDSPGVLHIGDSSTVTAKYVDADDGFGGTNVLVQDGAVLDCVPPSVVNVQATNILPYDATITFMTNELSRGTVRFGLACDALVNSVAEEDFESLHSLHLAGLAEDTVYFYAIDTVDTVGNASTFDGGGACYALTTADIPNFLTQELTGANPLQNMLIDFTPNETIDRYEGCEIAITALATDPTGGTPLDLLNNGFAQVTLADGATVSLFGVEYGSFFVGSNGYITFESGDVDGSESPADHFEQPRISALFDDLNPDQAGTVSWLQLSNRSVVTWENIPEVGQSSSNTFQVEMYFDGRITISFLGIAATDGITGLSDGAGLNEYFSSSDLASFGTCGPRPPRARRVNSFTVVETPVTVSLEATDDGLPDPPGALTYSITSLPTGGSLSDPNGGAITNVPYELVNHGTQVLYSPTSGDSGPDAFQYSANDGGAPPEGGDSAPANVLLQVDLDCNLNGIGDPFDLSSGTSPDCNINAVPDECDIAMGTSNDCEPNGVPDECQDDCNNNGITDGCDIAAGTSADCNGNATPDECDLAGWANNLFTNNFDPPIDIAGAGFTQHTVTIASPAMVTDVNVEVTVAHERIGDVWIGLRHNGVTRILVDRCGDEGDDFTSTRFDDQATTPICMGEAPFFGSFKPHQTLAGFHGLPIDGDWTLLIRDTRPGVVGEWLGWTLHVPVGSPDCNANAVPDECDADCNGNARPDDCDLAQGISLDTNADETPDECQCATLRGDVTGDARVDLRDAAGFQNCFGRQTEFTCACADMNLLDGVNLADVAAFGAALAGP